MRRLAIYGMFVIYCSTRMKRRSLICCCLLVVLARLPLFGQERNQRVYSLANRQFDSINRLIANAPDDTNKVIRLTLISALQYRGLNDTGNIQTTYAEQALSIASRLKSDFFIAFAYRSLGHVYQDRTEYQTAIHYYKMALDLAEKTNPNRTDEFYPPLLNLYFYLGDYPNAMETISREMAVAEKIKNKRKIAHCNNILGYIHFKQENYEKSELYYELYLRNANELNDSSLIAHALGEAADVFIREKKLDAAIANLEKVLDISISLAAIKEKPGDVTTRGFALQYKSKAFYRLGIIYQLKKDLSRALSYALEALAIARQDSPPFYDLALYHINAGSICLEQKKFPEAIRFLDYAFQLSKRINHRENIRDAAGALSQSYAGLQRFDSAYSFYQLYTGLKDSLVNNETKMKIAGIQGKYDVARKDREIAKQEQIRNILIASFLVLLLLLLLIYNHYRLKQKTLYQQEYNRQQNELFNVIVSTQDQERKRIAQDLHDSLGSVLSAAKLKLSSLEESKKLLSPDQLEKYKTSLALLDEASSELRNISHNIMPATLSKLGIVAALQNLIANISSHSGLQISFTAHALEGRIEETAEISIYRIILELINNIVKHADARKVTIQLIKYPNYINLVIEDDGRGFNYSKAVDEKKGIGLGNIQSRVEYLNGTIDIDSSPGKGTTVIIEVPSGQAEKYTNNLV